MKNTTLQELENQLEAVMSVMPQTLFQLRQRDKSAFLISRDIERIKDPVAFEKNKAHWEGHELRL
jgi:hypothetical protein